MKTFKRICVEDWEATDDFGNKFKVERGEEYLTSPISGGKVVVFSNFWVPVPARNFAGQKVFTAS